MNKFKKKTRSKMIAASIAILSSAAVVSTGFAAWVISGGDTKGATGTITADAVTERVITPLILPPQIQPQLISELQKQTLISRTHG